MASVYSVNKKFTPNLMKTYVDNKRMAKNKSGEHSSEESLSGHVTTPQYCVDDTSSV